MDISKSRDRPDSKLINLLGVRQICLGANKMDCHTAGYKQERHDEISFKITKAC